MDRFDRGRMDTFLIIEVAFVGAHVRKHRPSHCYRESYISILAGNERQRRPRKAAQKTTSDKMRMRTKAKAEEAKGWPNQQKDEHLH